MASTLGQELRQSTQTNSLLDGLVEQVLAYSRRINGVRGPDAELEPKMAKSTQTIGQVRSRPLFYNYVGSGLGNGPYVELEDGSVKLDLINGIGIHLFGHSHPRVVRAALSGAMSDVIQQGNLEPNAEYLEMSERLSRLVSKNSRMSHVWLATCGTMANENPLKIARQKKRGARMIITFKNAFAGRSTMMTE